MRRSAFCKIFLSGRTPGLRHRKQRDAPPRSGHPVLLDHSDANMLLSFQVLLADKAQYEQPAVILNHTTGAAALRIRSRNREHA